MNGLNKLSLSQIELEILTVEMGCSTTSTEWILVPWASSGEKLAKRTVKDTCFLEFPVFLEAMSHRRRDKTELPLRA